MYIYDQLTGGTHTEVTAIKRHLFILAWNVTDNRQLVHWDTKYVWWVVYYTLQAGYLDWNVRTGLQYSRISFFSFPSLSLSLSYIYIYIYIYISPLRPCIVISMSIWNYRFHQNIFSLIYPLSIYLQTSLSHHLSHSSWCLRVFSLATFVPLLMWFLLIHLPCT